MTSGLEMVKKSLGPDALIISTRTVKSSKLGLLGKSTLEITAAIDQAPTCTIKKPQSSLNRAGKFPVRQHPVRKRNINYIIDDSLDTSELEQDRPLSNYCKNYGQPPVQRQTPEQGTHTYQGATSIPSVMDLSREQEKQTIPESQTFPANTPKKSLSSAFSAPSQGEEKLMGEVEDLKKLVRSLANEIARLQPENQKTDNHVKTIVPVDATENTPEKDNKTSPALLQSKGVSSEISETINQSLLQNLSQEELQDTEKMYTSMVQAIQTMIEVVPPFHEEGEQQRIAFVGPTGVGKTTTLAKLAASKLSRGTRSIALITIDTYRIAAVEQLRVYGEIMNLPVEVVISPEQLEAALLKHRDCELILIDTAGRSPRDDFSINELATFFKPELNIESHLVLSATSRESELIDTIERFNKLDIYATIYTKLDECSSLGALLNVQTRNHSPIACLTNGQRVPEDLLELRPQGIAELILSSN